MKIYNASKKLLEQRIKGLCCHLELVLFAGIFNGLKDVPSVPPPHLQTGHVAPKPSLDQNSCLYSYDETPESMSHAVHEPTAPQHSSTAWNTSITKWPDYFFKSASPIPELTPN